MVCWLCGHFHLARLSDVSNRQGKHAAWVNADKVRLRDGTMWWWSLRNWYGLAHNKFMIRLELPGFSVGVWWPMMWIEEKEHLLEIGDVGWIELSMELGCPNSMSALRIYFGGDGFIRTPWNCKKKGVWKGKQWALMFQFDGVVGNSRGSYPRTKLWKLSSRSQKSN